MSTTPHEPPGGLPAAQPPSPAQAGDATGATDATGAAGVADLDQETLDLLHTIFELAREGETEALATYLDRGLPVNLTNSKGDTLLILAAYHNHPDTVQLLLDRGADTTRLNDRGQTALAAAVFRRSEPSVRAFLAAGADPAHGSPSAFEIVRFFELPEMLAVLEGRA